MKNFGTKLKQSLPKIITCSFFAISALVFIVFLIKTVRQGSFQSIYFWFSIYPFFIGLLLTLFLKKHPKAQNQHPIKESQNFRKHSKKFNIIYVTATILGSLLLSAIIEVIGYNFNATFNRPDSVPQVSYTENREGNKTTLSLDLNDQYVNKLRIDYEASNDIKYTVNYNKSGIYDLPEKSTKQDIFEGQFSYVVLNIDQKISEVTIEFETPENETISITNISIDNAFHFNFTRFAFIFLAICLLSSLIYFCLDGFKTERFHIYFSIVVMLLGSMIIIAQPASTVYAWDDETHFLNSMDLFFEHSSYSEGERQAARLVLDDSELAGFMSINSIEEQKEQNQIFSNTSNQHRPSPRTLSFSSAGYIPMAIGYNLASFLHIPFEVSFRIGKLFNLIFFTLLVAYAIKILKVGKRLFLVIALIPCGIFLASSYSYDPAVFAGIAIFIASLLNLFIDKDSKLDFKTALILILSISYACLTKTIYIPLLFLVLLIPKTKFVNPKQALKIKVIFSILAILLLATFVIPAVSGSMSGDSRGGDTSVNGQLSLIASHPTDYLLLLGNNAVKLFIDKFINTFTDFAYIANRVSEFNSNFFYIILFLIAFLFFVDNQNNLLTKKQRLSIFASIIVTIVLIWTALYLSYTPVGSDKIAGVQSRYFLPLLFPLLLCIQPKNIKNTLNQKNINAATIIIPTVIMFISVYFSFLVQYSF